MVDQTDYPVDFGCDVYIKDQNHQLLIGIQPFDTEMWMNCDSWDVDTACKLITLGRTLDVEFARANLGDGLNPTLEQIISTNICDVYDRAKTLAESSIKINNLKEINTLESWLKWAMQKGYSVDHLIPELIIYDDQIECKTDEIRHELRLKLFQPAVTTYNNKLRIANNDLVKSGGLEQKVGDTGDIETVDKFTTKKIWIDKARALAKDYIKLWAVAGFDATINDAAFYIECIFAIQNIRNTRGNFLREATVRREALTGITNRPKGFRSKNKKIPKENRDKLPEK